MARASSGRRALLKRLRARLRPTRAAERTVHSFIAALQAKLPQAEIMAGGSYAKGTFLRTSHDIDIFARFPPGTDDAEMARALRRALPRATVLHGSRDYVQLKHKGYLFEVVPVQHITDWRKALNVTDMSPLHVAYIQSHLSPAQKDDVRLAKIFCKAAGVYGAESYVRGFSGYVLELLIAAFGSFEGLLAHAQTVWCAADDTIDPAQHYRSAQEARRRLNEAKIAGPLLLVDPLQPERNAAAALSLEAYRRFAKAATDFLAKPSLEAFDTAMRPRRVRAAWKGKRVLFVRKTTPRGKHDVIGCRLLARHERAVGLFKENGFLVHDAQWRFGIPASHAWYVLESTIVPPTVELRGPPSSMPEAVTAFRNVHPRAYERDGRWYALGKRRYTEATRVLRAAWGRT